MLGLPWVIRNGLASQVMETLTIGPFLVAYALAFDASNFVIGLLAAIPFLTQFLQLPAVGLVERVRKRRLLSVVFAASSRPMMLVMALAAFMPEPSWALALLMAGLAGRYGLGAFVGCGWNSWMRDLIPEERLGRFFARRLMLMSVLGVALSLSGALFIDTWSNWWPDRRLAAYPVLLVVAFLGGLYSVHCMRFIPEPVMQPSRQLHLRERLAQPFRDANFRRLILFLGSWNFAVNLAAPFFTVYLFRRLGFSLTGVIFLAILSQAANVLMIQRWGAIADRFSNKSVLRVCAPLFILCIFAWTFTTFPEKHALTVPLLVVIHILTGIATAGVTLSTSNISLKLAPKGDAASYLAVTSLINSLAAGIAPIVGGLTVDFFIGQELSLVLQWSGGVADLAIETLNLRHWDFFFLFATLIGVYSIHRLAFVEEEGEVEERIIIDEILISTRQSVKNLSSIAGLRALADFPLAMLRRRRRKRRK
ncbi:MAG: MFS transporter [Rhodospirillales bacterium]|nr:MFS transporter [Rhodospirillales bacterium]